MNESTLPRINGYTLVNAHVCPRCSGPARVLYRANGAPPERENNQMGYREVRFATGTLLIGSKHIDSGYGVSYAYYDVSCGYFVPQLLPSPEAFINQLFARLYPSFGGFGSYANTANTPLRITRFDVKRFLAAPWVLHAPALEPREKPLILVPHPALLRQILVHGAVPAVGANAIGVSRDQADSTPSLFLAAIGAVTEERTF
jgi:hypothetical protein